MPKLPVIILSLFVGSVAVVQAYGPRQWDDAAHRGFIQHESKVVPQADGFGFDCKGARLFIDVPSKHMIDSKTWSTRPVQWSTEDGGNGHWYMTMRDFEARAVPWSDARDRCEAMGGHLVTLTEARETAFLVRSLGHLHRRAIGLGTFGWIGATQEFDGCWVWVTNEPWEYTNWQLNSIHPVPSGTNSHVVMCGTNQRGAMGSWRDRGGSTGRFPMMNCWTIEWSADHNRDGIVDFGQIQQGMLIDVNENGIPDCHEFGDHCMPGKPDVNGDGQVDLHDFHVVIDGMGGWHQDEADVNCDGQVDAEDILGVLYKLGTHR